mmetsp:Transcript_66607/g.203795  ORF Transcript_66607/g.203795 Transcript_66607/m.203795 type:complete len:245 (-) Transcript_66607:691-1425(-)
MELCDEAAWTSKRRPSDNSSGCSGGWTVVGGLGCPADESSSSSALLSLGDAQGVLGSIASGKWSSREIIILPNSRWACITSAMSKLLALPWSSREPFTSSSTEMESSPSAFRRSKSELMSWTSSSMADSQVLISGMSRCCRNSSLPMAPLSLSSTCWNSLFILRVCNFIARSFLFIIMVSFWLATVKVTWRKTPMMTRTTANPIKNWWATKKMTYHSLTFSVSALHGTIQFPMVSSNIVSIPRA